MAGNGFAFLEEKFPGVKSSDNVIQVPREKLLSVMEFLKEQGFDYLNDLTAVDWQKHFTLVYQVRSYSKPEEVTVKTDLERDDPRAPSVTGIWKAGNWMEREVYDMFGIVFEGHPNLRRILLGDDFVGYPLRKDFQS
ncbi:MAG: NADH-quinone oxidoreductase subunit C [Peptococcaceae bacterium]|jgi:NADH/F420H2 dehydrogenase subunit C|nr:NADH-quinone oxidoreductase subunit C [Peptococcaceae bacterium]MDH7525688.1 NADH-quinone oxidoreductase subunit C [Peptococcaceae bacterium]